MINSKEIENLKVKPQTPPYWVILGTALTVITLVFMQRENHLNIIGISLIATILVISGVLYFSYQCNKNKTALYNQYINLNQRFDEQGKLLKTQQKLNRKMENELQEYKEHANLEIRSFLVQLLNDPTALQKLEEELKKQEGNQNEE